MIRGREMRAALAEASVRAAAREADKALRLAKAVRDVLDGTVESAPEAAAARGVSVDAVRRAVKASREQAASGAGA